MTLSATSSPIAAADGGTIPVGVEIDSVNLPPYVTEAAAPESNPTT
ncbi:MAG TPA: hypothetical protein PLN33_14010 [Hyphomonadaceae bacterium]|jgi:hypothetical protein|nr:hypothetical protein [Hyphomonadaceae bacterium]HPN05263.1 hypothetical protein [Hyphomonadaceae bacterium]